MLTASLMLVGITIVVWCASLSRSSDARERLASSIVSGPPEDADQQVRAFAGFGLCFGVALLAIGIARMFT
jgi:hypothetical protein